MGRVNLHMILNLIPVWQSHTHSIMDDGNKLIKLLLLEIYLAADRKEGGREGGQAGGKEGVKYVQYDSVSG